MPLVGVRTARLTLSCLLLFAGFAVLTDGVTQGIELDLTLMFYVSFGTLVASPAVVPYSASVLALYSLMCLFIYGEWQKPIAHVVATKFLPVFIVSLHYCFGMRVELLTKGDLLVPQYVILLHTIGTLYKHKSIYWIRIASHHLLLLVVSISVMYISNKSAIKEDDYVQICDDTLENRNESTSSV